MCLKRTTLSRLLQIMKWCKTCILSPLKSPQQLSSAEHYTSADLDEDLAEQATPSSVNSLSPCNSKSSEVGTHFDLESFSEGSQADIEFLQNPSLLGMDHPESFMDRETDIVDNISSDHSLVHVSSPSDHHQYEIIQKKKKTQILPRIQHPM